MTKKTLYEVLGVPEDASHETLSQALDIIKKSRFSSVDDPPSEDAANRLKFAHQAFSTLANPASRAQYDEKLRHDRTGESQARPGSNRPESAAAPTDEPGGTRHLQPQTPTSSQSVLNRELARDSGGIRKSSATPRLYKLGGILIAMVMAIVFARIGYRSFEDKARAAELGAMRDGAISSVSEELSDPFSAQFRGLYHLPKFKDESGAVVCGQVNAKNQLGGYVGWRDWLLVDGKLTISESAEDSRIGIGVFCDAPEKDREYLPTD